MRFSRYIFFDWIMWEEKESVMGKGYVRAGFPLVHGVNLMLLTSRLAASTRSSGFNDLRNNLAAMFE